jgi:hypothetical protein
MGPMARRVWNRRKMGGNGFRRRRPSISRPHARTLMPRAFEQFPGRLPGLFLGAQQHLRTAVQMDIAR